MFALPWQVNLETGSTDTGLGGVAGVSGTDTAEAGLVGVAGVAEGTAGTAKGSPGMSEGTLWAGVTEGGCVSGVAGCR